jgi:hypothetical protein
MGEPRKVVEAVSRILTALLVDARPVPKLPLSVAVRVPFGLRKLWGTETLR